MHLLLGGGISEPGGYSPTSWYKANAQTGYVDNDTLTTVVDSSASGFDLNSVNGTPKWRSNIINGLPAFQSAANGDIARANVGSGTIWSAAAGTTFVVFMVSNAIQGYPWLISETGVAARVIAIANVAGTANFAMSNNDGAADTTGNIALTTGAWVIATLLHTGGSIYSGVSDTRTASLQTVTSGNTNFAAGDDIFILGSGGANQITGYVAEAISFATALSEADRQVWERWFGAKYGIVLPY